MALPELVSVAYENQQYNPKLEYLTGVARDDAAYMICKHILDTTELILKEWQNGAKMCSVDSNILITFWCDHCLSYRASIVAVTCSI